MNDIEQAVAAYLVSQGWRGGGLPPLVVTGHQRCAIRFPVMHAELGLCSLYALGYADGVQTYRAEVAAILECPEAKGRERLAIDFVMECTDPADAIERLREAARADAPEQTVVELRRPPV